MEDRAARLRSMDPQSRSVLITSEAVAIASLLADSSADLLEGKVIAN